MCGSQSASWPFLLASARLREGEAAREQWERWMTAEDAYIEAEQPAAHADVVLRGDRDIWR
jgi:hypothetical protein